MEQDHLLCGEKKFKLACNCGLILKFFFGTVWLTRADLRQTTRVWVELKFILALLRDGGLVS